MFQTTIGVPPPPPPPAHTHTHTAIGEPSTGRVSLCTFSIQQTMCAYAKFSHFRKIISNSFKYFSSKLSKPHYNVIMIY